MATDSHVHTFPSTCVYSVTFCLSLPLTLFLFPVINVRKQENTLSRTHTHAHAHAHTHTRTHTHTHANTHTHTHTHIQTQTHTHIRTNAHTRTCAHTHSHRCRQKRHYSPTLILANRSLQVLLLWVCENMIYESGGWRESEVACVWVNGCCCDPPPPSSHAYVHTYTHTCTAPNGQTYSRPIQNSHDDREENGASVRVRAGGGRGEEVFFGDSDRSAEVYPPPPPPFLSHSYNSLQMHARTLFPLPTVNKHACICLYS